MAAREQGGSHSNVPPSPGEWRSIEAQRDDGLRQFYEVEAHYLGLSPRAKAIYKYKFFLLNNVDTYECHLKKKTI